MASAVTTSLESNWPSDNNQDDETTPAVTTPLETIWSFHNDQNDEATHSSATDVASIERMALTKLANQTNEARTKITQFIGDFKSYQKADCLRVFALIIKNPDLISSETTNLESFKAHCRNDVTLIRRKSHVQLPKERTSTG